MSYKITYLRILSLLSFTLAFTLLSSCEQHDNTYDVQSTAQTPIAHVEGLTIYQEDIDAELQALPEHLQYLRTSTEAHQKVLETLIRRSVLSQKAIEFGLESDPLTRRQIKKSRDSILIETLRNWQISRLATPSDEMIQQYYEQHMADFTISEQIHARHILLRTEQEAFDLIKEMKSKKADFATLAAKFSLDDNNKSRGGDLNWFPRGMMDSSFEKVAFALKNVGDVSKPVKTQYGWHVIELLGKRPSSKQTLHEVEGEIMKILQQQQLNAWVDNLVKESNVKIIQPQALDPTLQLPIDQPR